MAEQRPPPWFCCFIVVTVFVLFIAITSGMVALVAAIVSVTPNAIMIAEHKHVERLSLYSANEDYCAGLRHDGNLVVTTRNWFETVWETGAPNCTRWFEMSGQHIVLRGRDPSCPTYTFPTPGNTLFLSDDGQLFVMSGSPLYAANLPQISSEIGGEGGVGSSRNKTYDEL